MGKKNKQKRKNKEDKLGESEQLNEGQEISQNEDQEQILESPVEEPEQESPRKRDHDDDDSDAEEKPKRKKKKKPVVPVESTGTANKKGAKSIRQMKREKHAARQAEAQVLTKDQHKSECINYLSQWKHNKQNWKFMKAKQVWLFKNKFSSTLVPDESWATLLEYFDSAQGNIRNMLLADANKIIKQLDDWTETHKENDDDDDAEETEDGVSKPDDNVYKRARDLIQCLGE